MKQHPEEYERQENWCQEHQAPADECPVCQAEVIWPARQLCDRPTIQEQAAKDMAAIGGIFQELDRIFGKARKQYGAMEE